MKMAHDCTKYQHCNPDRVTTNTLTNCFGFAYLAINTTIVFIFRGNCIDRNSIYKNETFTTQNGEFAHLSISKHKKVIHIFVRTLSFSDLKTVVYCIGLTETFQ